MSEIINCEETVPNIDECIKQNLTTGSHPVHWFDDFMPTDKKAARFTTSSERITIDNMEEYKSIDLQCRRKGSKLPIL